LALWVSFMEPHSPFDFPLEDASRPRPDSYRPPRAGPQDGPQTPLIFRDLTEADKKGIIAAYYTSVAFLDRNIGRVLDALRKAQLEDDTFIVYMADHGYSLGHHGRFEKHCGYDPALRVPLIMRYPGKVRRGTVRDFTEHIDVPATVVDVMGLDPLPVQHGQSLRPYLEGRRPPAPRTHIFSEYLENEEAFVRTDRYKLIYCTGRRARGDGYITSDPTPGRYVRLFDLKRDPGEFADVAAQHPDVVRQMQATMLERIRATHPESGHEPQGVHDALDFFLRPRDV
jgi:choline-sulfatase